MIAISKRNGAIAVSLLTTIVAHAEPVVMMGTYADAISAETTCQLLREGKITVADRAAGLAMCDSVRDPRQLAGRLEGEIMNQLATNPRCKGVTVVSQLLNFDTNNPQVNPAVSEAIEHNDYWELNVDYRPVGEVYSWVLWPYFSSQTAKRTGRLYREGTVLGEDTPAQIADRVCIVVTGQGANIR
jgi:hypothetical protein